MSASALASRGLAARILSSRHIRPRTAVLQNAWAGAKPRGLDTLTFEDIDTEIDTVHRKGVGYCSEGG
jgi:hypothetical protein